MRGKIWLVTWIMVLLSLAGCGDDGSAVATTPIPPTLEPAQQQIAIQTAIQQQFTLTANAQALYAPTQTINAAVQQTAQVKNTQTAEYQSVITEDAYHAITATMFARTATQDALNANPTNIQRTVDALVSQRFTATARSQLQIDINLTVEAAVEQTVIAEPRLTASATKEPGN